MPFDMIKAHAVHLITKMGLGGGGVGGVVSTLPATFSTKLEGTSPL